ncbi:MAG: O-methyltransferase [Candidatus Woesearchaeota archaeon]
MTIDNIYILNQKISQSLKQLEYLKQSSYGKTQNISLKNLNFYNITNVQSLFLSQYIKYQCKLKLKYNTIINSKAQNINNAMNILEFGTSNGYSLLSMLKGVTQHHLSLKNLVQSSISDLNNHLILSFEIDTFKFNEAIKNLKEYKDIFQITLYNEDMFKAHNIIFKMNLKGFDIIFVDCNQEFYKEVFEYILKYDLLSKSGSILFENTLSHVKSDFFFQSLDLNNQINSFEIIHYPLHNGFIELRRI